jgi:thymidylate synthase ThyX
MEVKLEFKTSMRDLIEGFLFCTDKMDKIDDYVKELRFENTFSLTEKGKKLIKNNLVDTENPHMQLMNQVQIRLQIKDVTRAVLQEFARHRLGNEMTVKSTRYALHKIAEDKRIPDRFFFNVEDNNNEVYNIVGDYYYIPEDNFNSEVEFVDWINARFDELLKIKYSKINYKLSNDHLKKYINEYMYCNINTVMSGTALKNFLRKRLDSVAWYQIRDLAIEIYKQIPGDWKPLFKVYKYKKIEPFIFSEPSRVEGNVNNGGVQITLSKKNWESLQMFFCKNLLEKKDLTEGLD